MAKDIKQIIAEMRSKVADVTKGSWAINFKGATIASDIFHVERFAERSATLKRDADFIVSASSNITAILDYIEDLTKENERLHKILAITATP